MSDDRNIPVALSEDAARWLSGLPGHKLRNLIWHYLTVRHPPFPPIATIAPTARMEGTVLMVWHPNINERHTDALRQFLEEKAQEVAGA